MELSVNVGHLIDPGVSEKKRTIFEAMDIIYDAGFRCVDVSANFNSTPEKTAEYALSKGMRINQCHAPFNRYAKQDYAEFSKQLETAAHNCKALQCAILVVHADEFDFANMSYTKEKAMEFNYRLFSPIVEYAENNGFKVAFESVFQDMSPDYPRLCSMTEELLEMESKFNSKATGICWDFGHAKCQYPETYVQQLLTVKDKLISTHVHDNFYSKDLHLYPFMGNTDWNGCMKALKEIDYKGEFTFEIVYNKFPSAMALDLDKMLYRTGEYLLSLA